MESIWQTVFFGNPVKDWAIALGSMILFSLIARGLQKIILTRIQQLASKTDSTVDDFVIRLLQRSVMPILYALAVYTGFQYLELPARFSRVLQIAMLAVAVFFTVNIITNIFSYLFMRFASRGDAANPQVKQAKGILLILKIVLWIAGIIFLVDNLGYDITTIVTGLGIGGIAIALAAQTILGDLFSYLVIFFDKPFETGDFIVIGDKSGIVEYIGVKTTRLRTLSGEQLVMSNTDLTNSRVQNFKRMEKRRVVISLGINYETGVDKIKAIPGMIKEIVEEHENVTFDRAHFSGFGDFSLNFEIVYYILSGDYVLYMDRQQDIYLRIMERFEKEGIGFAYRMQKLFLAGSPEPILYDMPAKQ